MLNALDAMEKRPQKQLRLSVAQRDDKIVLKVADTGHGIKPEHLDHIFDPFFTTKSPDRGSGLGLSVCVSIVRQHSGEISVKSTVGVGSEFEVIFPKMSGAVAPRISFERPENCIRNGLGLQSPPRSDCGRRRVHHFHDSGGITERFELQRRTREQRFAGGDPFAAGRF